MAGNRIKELNYLEFYSGIGGWSYAIDEAVNQVNEEDNNKINNSKNFSLSRVAAIDTSDAANKVFEYNFHEKPLTMNIERVTKQYYQKNFSGTNIWLMSPPCQPYTRQNKHLDADSQQTNNVKRDLNDPRAASFLHLCSLLHGLPDNELPAMICMENVVGFEISKSCMFYRTICLTRMYTLFHFHLNPPTSVGIANERERYYCLGIHESFLDDDFNAAHGLHCETSKNLQGLNRKESKIGINFCAEMGAPIVNTALPSRRKINDSTDGTGDSNIVVGPIRDYIDPELLSVSSTEECAPKRVKLDHEEVQDKLSNLLIPSKLLDKSAAWCFDIVSLNDRRTSCFTHSYGKFIRGTGSVLLFRKEDQHLFQNHKLGLVDPSERKFDENWANGLDLNGKLRYFSGSEIARLFGFPVRCSIVHDKPDQKLREEDSSKNNYLEFPDECALKKQWQLLGNSLNVKVAKEVVHLGLMLMRNVKSH